MSFFGSGFLVEVGDQIEEACFAKATGFSVFFLDKIQYRRWHVNFRAPTSRDRRVLGKTACVRAFTAGTYLGESHDKRKAVSEITEMSPKIKTRLRGPMKRISTPCPNPVDSYRSS